MGIEIRLLRRGDESVLERVAPEVFDEDPDANLARRFLAEPHHHLAVAVDDGLVVGFASAVDYLHPDKPSELWINEVGVAPTHRGQGLGKAVLSALFDAGRAVGCAEAWVLTHRPNTAAMRLYASQGGRESTEDEVMFTFPLTAARGQGNADGAPHMGDGHGEVRVAGSG